MQARIDAVAASTPARLRPVESIQTQRQAQEEHAGLAREREPAASFAPRPDTGVNAYTPPVSGHSFVTPDPVAPALAEALVAEPWGHPMPQKAMWEQAAAVRERTPKAEPEPVEASVTVTAATATPPAPAASSAPAATPVAAPAAPAAPVSPAWLTSLLKAR
jgi:hypothetical protein